MNLLASDEYFSDQSRQIDARYGLFPARQLWLGMAADQRTESAGFRSPSGHALCGQRQLTSEVTKLRRFNIDQRIINRVEANLACLERMILGRYGCQQFIDGSVTTLVSGMHAMRREIHTTRHGRVVRFDHL
jgi:hypothetical protein